MCVCVTRVTSFISHFYSDKVILNNALDLGKDGTDIGSALKYYDSINLYMKQLRGALGELRDDIL